MKVKRPEVEWRQDSPATRMETDHSWQDLAFRLQNHRPTTAPFGIPGISSGE
jgi:hypothetical protein